MEVLLMGDEYIKKEDAVKAVANAYWHGTDCECYAFARKALDNVPTADVAPVRHGHWVVIDAEEPRRYGCSECKRLSWHMENYCGNCGARMDGESDE
jgi:hypothetical protein